MAFLVLLYSVNIRPILFSWTNTPKTKYMNIRLNSFKQNKSGKVNGKFVDCDIPTWSIIGNVMANNHQYNAYSLGYINENNSGHKV